MVFILALFLQISPVGRFFSSTRDSSEGIFFAPGFEKDTVSWFFIEYGGKFSLSKNLSIDIGVVFKHGNDSTYPFYNWHKIGEMDYRKALLRYHPGNVTLSCGLDAPTLSKGNFTKLFFDGFEPQFPQIQFFIKKAWFSFFYLAGQMEEVRSNPFKPTGDTKYFAYHEAGIRWKNLAFSFGEGVLFKSYNGTHPDWYLFSPVALWYPRQANCNRTDLNIAWLFGVEWEVSRTGLLYGELFVDDAPYKREADENPRVGMLTGFDRNGKKWRFISEAALVTRYTYSYYPGRLELSWFYNSYPLGSVTGTDFVKFSLFIMKKGKINPFGYFETLLQGEGRMGEPFEVGNLSKRVLLSGQTKKTIRVEAGFRVSTGKVNITFRSGVVKINSVQPLIGISFDYKR